MKQCHLDVSEALQTSVISDKELRCIALGEKEFKLPNYYFKLLSIENLSPFFRTTCENLEPCLIEYQNMYKAKGDGELPDSEALVNWYKKEMR